MNKKWKLIEINEQNMWEMKPKLNNNEEKLKKKCKLKKEEKVIGQNCKINIEKWKKMKQKIEQTIKKKWKLKKKLKQKKLKQKKIEKKIKTKNKIILQIGFERVDGARGYIVGLKSPSGENYLKQVSIDQPVEGFRPKLVFSDLEQETEYIADIQILYPLDNTKPHSNMKPDPLTIPISTIAKVIYSLAPPKCFFFVNGNMKILPKKYKPKIWNFSQNRKIWSKLKFFN